MRMPAKHCVMGGCSNDSEDGWTFLTWPRDPKVSAAWNIFVKSTRADWVSNKKSSCICCNHFTRDQFVNYVQWSYGFADQLRKIADASPSIKYPKHDWYHMRLMGTASCRKPPESVVNKSIIVNSHSEIKLEDYNAPEMAQECRKIHPCPKDIASTADQIQEVEDEMMAATCHHSSESDKSKELITNVLRTMDNMDAVDFSQRSRNKRLKRISFSRVTVKLTLNQEDDFQTDMKIRNQSNVETQTQQRTTFAISVPDTAMFSKVSTKTNKLVVKIVPTEPESTLLAVSNGLGNARVPENIPHSPAMKQELSGDTKPCHGGNPLLVNQEGSTTHPPAVSISEAKVVQQCDERILRSGTQSTSADVKHEDGIYSDSIPGYCQEDLIIKSECQNDLIDSGTTSAVRDFDDGITVDGCSTEEYCPKRSNSACIANQTKSKKEANNVESRIRNKFEYYEELFPTNPDVAFSIKQELDDNSYRRASDVPTRTHQDFNADFNAALKQENSPSHNLLNRTDVADRELQCRKGVPLSDGETNVIKSSEDTTPSEKNSVHKNLNQQLDSCGDKALTRLEQKNASERFETIDLEGIHADSKVLQSQLNAITSLSATETGDVQINATETLHKCLDCQNLITQAKTCCTCINGTSKLVQNSQPKLHKGAESKVCPACLEQFASLHLLKRHIQTHSKPFACDMCKKNFKTSSGLKQHRRISHQQRTRICQTCNKTFKMDAIQFKEHKRIHPRFVCSTCNMGFTHVRKLKQHREAHFEVKPYRCKICSKRYTTHSNLKRHLQAHSVHSPIVCATCHKEFKFGIQLKRHLLKHTGESSYACPKCDKVFITSLQIEHHTRSHTGDLPYKCPACRKGFHFVSRLKQHLHQTNHALPSVV